MSRSEPPLFDRPKCSDDDCEAYVVSAVGRLGDDDPLCSSCIEEAMRS